MATARKKLVPRPSSRYRPGLRLTSGDWSKKSISKKFRRYVMPYPAPTLLGLAGFYHGIVIT